jgi:tetratricopeptide (TPR) repeat protein
LEQLANWGQRQDIPELWFVPAGTEADYVPNRSCLNHSPSDPERTEIESIEREGRTLQEAGRFREAAEKYRQGLARYEEFADFHFQLGECLTRDKNSTQAATHYAAALELDGLPVRMTRPWREKMAEVAGRHGITILDTDAILRPKTPSGILDRSVFLDYVHPNLRAYYALGMAAVARIEGNNQLRATVGQPKATAHADFASAIASAGFMPKDLAMAYRRTAEADRWMKRLQFDSSWLVRDAQKYETWSRQLDSGQIVPGQSGTESLK